MLIITKNKIKFIRRKGIKYLYYKYIKKGKVIK